MKSYVFTVDGVEYRRIHVLSLKRSFAVLDGENAGRMMEGSMQRDLIGTYYNYSLVIDPDDTDPEEYDALYEILSAPVKSHTVSAAAEGQQGRGREIRRAGGGDEGVLLRPGGDVLVDDAYAHSAGLLWGSIETKFTDRLSHRFCPLKISSSSSSPLAT